MSQQKCNSLKTVKAIKDQIKIKSQQVIQDSARIFELEKVLYQKLQDKDDQHNKAVVSYIGKINTLQEEAQVLNEELQKMREDVSELNMQMKEREIALEQTNTALLAMSDREAHLQETIKLSEKYSASLAQELNDTKQALHGLEADAASIRVAINTLGELKCTLDGKVSILECIQVARQVLYALSCCLLPA